MPAQKKHPRQLPEPARLSETVGNKARRKQHARKNPGRSPWFGLGLFGLIGWSITVPALLGIWFGLWLDKHSSTEISWTLTLFFIGLTLGCINAWLWIRSENRNSH